MFGVSLTVKRSRKWEFKFHWKEKYIMNMITILFLAGVDVFGRAKVQGKRQGRNGG